MKRLRHAGFPGSARYWDTRYRVGGISGPGSRGAAAAFKATFLNEFVEQHDIRTVIEFGCGDGYQLSLARYPRYVGLDVSARAIAICGQLFAGDETKSFFRYEPGAFYDGAGVLRSDLALSLDVIFHLVEDDVFERYMADLFTAASRFVVVYSTNVDGVESAVHVKHRRFTEWVALHKPGWVQSGHTANPEPGTALEPHSDFFVFSPQAAGVLVDSGEPREERIRAEPNAH